ncbi:hypothetical protein [Nesterenkonia pannonica]|nr:hypothetical protein [Nesterenkonia pannonica]
MTATAAAPKAASTPTKGKLAAISAAYPAPGSPGRAPPTSESA